MTKLIVCWYLILIGFLLLLIDCWCRCISYSVDQNKLKIVLSKGSHHPQNTDWAIQFKTPYIIYSKIEGEENYVKECPDTEASTYFHHIIQNYDALDEWTLFAHAHETSWHHPTSLLTSSTIDLEKMEKENIKFFSVNHSDQMGKPIMMMTNEHPNLEPSELTSSEYQTLFKYLFGIEAYEKACDSDSDDGRVINKQSYPMVSQFFVHRSRILNRPKSFYEKCLKSLTDYNLLTKPSTQQIGGYFFEALWHYIFGENILYEPKIKNYEDYPLKES